MARLFIAVWPPEEVVAKLESLPHADQPGIRFVPKVNWHITLRFLGEADPYEVTNALDSATLPPATAHLGPAVTVMSDRALVIPVDGLDALAAAVTLHTSQIGQASRRRYVGHLTLARLKPPAQIAPVVGATVSATFDVHEFALIQSRLDPQGARYETIKTWSLA